jgi:hypothetical protein
MTLGFSDKLNHSTLSNACNAGSRRARSIKCIALRFYYALLMNKHIKNIIYKLSKYFLQKILRNLY